jgi:regulator of sigma E protease
MVKRGDSLFQRVIALEGNPMTEGQKLIGIMQNMPVSYEQSYPPLQAVEYGVKSTLNFVVLNYVGLYKLISRPETIKSSVGGPVMIYSLSSQSAKKGWNAWLMFVAAISLVLMIMNLLPIPVLDGGHIMFAIVQGIIGKPIPVRIQIIAQNVGFVLLMLLMVYAFYNDFTKVFARAVSTMGKP